MSRALHRSRVVGRRGTRRTNAGIALAGLVLAGADRTRHASVRGAGGNGCVANGAQAWLSAARQVKEKSPAPCGSSQLSTAVVRRVGGVCARCLAPHRMRLRRIASRGANRQHRRCIGA